ncbi:MAG: hypothetical protein GY913_16035 [Proteobacteria bacterium]|nr:hypothetical protein [Pseudomonadota bacterium]
MLLVGAALAGKVTVPVDVGVGPSAVVLNGDAFAQQPVYGAVRFSLQAVIDKKTLKANKKKIPKKYRAMVNDMDEVRITPKIWIPDNVYLSPPVQGAGLYGLGWRFVSVGVPLGPIDLDAGVIATAFYLHGPAVPSTLFVRPGLNASAEIELPLNKDKTWLVSGGWDSRVHIPQELGGFGISDDPVGDLWHVGHGYLKLHHRFPYTVRI